MSERNRWERAIDQKRGRVLILEETSSTQDAAIAHHLQVGDVCGTLHQTCGRGRRGKSWDALGGVALTVVLHRCTSVVSIAIAGTLASNLQGLIPSNEIGIKWPNDLIVEGKKLAGILIEQRGDLCYVGVGVNVLHTPKVEGQVVTSLATLGFDGDRASVAALVAQSVFEAFQVDEEVAIRQWRRRDVLMGTRQRVISAGREYEGIVLDIDPCLNLRIETSTGIITLQSGVSTILPSS